MTHYIKLELFKVACVTSSNTNNNVTSYITQIHKTANLISCNVTITVLSIPAPTYITSDLEK